VIRPSKLRRSKAPPHNKDFPTECVHVLLS
jgi:hypothetical protein